MRFEHILHALYCEPWLINPEMHNQLCQIVDAHVTGAAHAPDGNVSEFVNANGALKPLQIVSGIAVVPMVGVIGKRIGMMERSSGVMDVDDFTENLQIAVDNDDVRGILLDVNSPGGTITGIPEGADMVREATSLKPIVAFTDTTMASAAYWLSVGADAIVASQSSAVGSIGVFSSILDTSRAFKEAGLEQVLFKTGKFKALGMNGVPVTQEQRDHMQERVDKIFDWFAGAVIEGRVQVGEGAMEGQTFRGVESKQMNLIDEVGSKEDAFDMLLDLVAMRDN